MQIILHACKSSCIGQIILHACKSSCVGQISKIYHWNRDLFIRKCCGGSIDNLTSCWNSQHDHPAFEHHPMKERSDCSSFAIPLAIHADGANVITIGKKMAKHMDTISWAPLLDRSRKASQLNYVIVFVFQLSMLTEAGMLTMEDVWQCICWSFTALFNGRHPTSDWRHREFTLADNDAFTL